jgi:hypothetical protein
VPLIALDPRPFTARLAFSYANESQQAIEIERGRPMHARTLIIAGAVIALAAPTGATAKLTPRKHPGQQLAKHVVARHVTPRVLCICVTTPVTHPAQSEVVLEAQSDLDLIAHSLEPAYASFQTTPELQAQYDAVLIANGLSPYFKRDTGGSR